MRKVTFLAVLVALLILAGCSTPSTKAKVPKPLYSRTPEEVVKRAFEFCRDGNYSEGARIYVNGPTILESMPAVAKEAIDKPCFTYDGTATRYEIVKQEIRGEGAIISIRAYVYPADDSRSKNELKYWGATLIKKPQGWLIAEAI